MSDITGNECIGVNEKRMWFGNNEKTGFSLFIQAITGYFSLSLFLSILCNALVSTPQL
jgi:hypothetical protein